MDGTKGFGMAQVGTLTASSGASLRELHRVSRFRNAKIGRSLKHLLVTAGFEQVSVKSGALPSRCPPVDPAVWGTLGRGCVCS